MGRNNRASNYDMSLYQTPIYRSWYNMKTRCYNINGKYYSRYGGRGIKVCDQWMTFEGFLKDMHSSYKDGLQLDRINNDGNYEPSNCRWADSKTQCRNRHNNTWLTLNGETKTLAEWTEISGLKSSTFRQRLYAYKWPLEKCFQPLNQY